MKPETITLVVNGAPRSASRGQSVGDLLATTGFKPTQVVVERNGQVLDRAGLARVALQEGDRIEIIVPVAGG